MNRPSIIAFLFLLIVSISYTIGFYTSQTTHKRYLVNHALSELIDRQHQILQQLVSRFDHTKQRVIYADDYDFSTRIYENGTLIDWSDNNYVPEYSKIKQSDTLYTIEDLGNIFLISRKSVHLEGESLKEFFVITRLKSQYEIQNEYLISGWNPLLTKDVSIEIDENGWPLNYHGKEFLKIRFLDQKASISHLSEIRVLLFIIGSILLFSLIASVSMNYRGWVILGILLLRSLQLYFLPEFKLFDCSLSDPLIYYQNWFMPSLSDVLINIIILLHFALWLSSLLIHSKWLIRISSDSLWGKRIILFVFSLCSLLCYYAFFALVWGLIGNSNYTLDISSSLIYDGNRVVILAIVSIAAIGIFYLNHTFFTYFKHWTQSIIDVLVCVLPIGLLGILNIDYFLGVSGIWILSWIVFRIGGLYTTIKRFQYKALGYSFLFGITISTLVAYASYEYSEKSQRIQKSRFASSLIIGNDVLGEYYINQVLESIRSDVFIRTRFLNQVLAQSNIKLRILTSLPYYLDKYEVAVYTYDRLGAPYGSTEASDLDYWIHQFAIPGYETGYQGVYFQKATTGRSKYIAITPIDFYGNTIGHIVIELTQKKFTSTSVFPSLLVENSPTSSTLTFDYLIYKDDQLVYSYGGDPDMIRLEAEDRIKILQVTNGKEIDGRHLMAFKMDDGNILFVSSPVYPWSFILANISFYFLIAVIAISIVYVILRFFFHVGSFSLGNKIQLYIGVSFIVPMMIITIVLLEVLKQTYSDEIAQNFEKRAKTIAENLVSEVESFINNRVNRDQFFYELSKAADYTQTDMIIYHLNGKLLGTNRGEVFNWNLMSRQINPQALHYIQSGNGQLIVLNERIGNLDFKTVYTGIYGIEDGNLMAIISLPFFDFKNQLQKQQLEIFHDLMILIAIVFIITMVVGQVNLKRIIMPIKTIAHRLNKINYLQEQTPFLEYSSQDEIGLLVSEFNSMVLKLEASKQELLKIQKETAWKEIARQVAHEIKNPLTPMRLKIQQLMRHFEPDTRQYRSLESLLSQVDSLASIADSFSAFAKMPAPENHLFNLSKVIAQSASLFQSENVTMHLAIQEGVMVNTDQKMLSQILNNLILNAIQSKVDSLHVIHIGLTTQSDKAIITVEDDGDGIPMEHQDKIFKPYFSTKETGSGIGLALAKKGIEQANGAIWFDSEAGKGTKFYISLPIA